MPKRRSSGGHGFASAWLDQPDKALVEAAARLRGVSLSGFIRLAAVERARQELRRVIEAQENSTAA